MGGKNFSCNNVDAKRRKADFYETPFSITRHLLSSEQLVTPILEPAAGSGAIVKVLCEDGLTVEAYDIERDFLLEDRRFPTIVTNPPYSLAHEFILKAKQVATDEFWFLLPLAYLHGKRRHDEIYADTVFPLAQVKVLVRYPMLGEPLREDGKYNTGMMVYAWFGWQKSWSGPPQISWIDNDADVLRKASNAK